MSDEHTIPEGEYDEDWWACPKCDAPTYICHGLDLPTKRTCTECEWEFSFAEIDRREKRSAY